MSFLLFLIVFVISNNYGAARPSIDSDSNSVTNMLDEYDNDKMIFKMPTPLEQGTTIQIYGTLKNNTEILKVILGENDGVTENCEITLNIETKTITVTPSIEGYDNDFYNITLSKEVQTKFILHIHTRTLNNGQESIGIFFQEDGNVVSNQLLCDIKNYKTIRYIIMQEGVSRVNSLVFDFQ